MRKIIVFNGKKAEITIKSTTCRGTGETEHNVTVEGIGNNYISSFTRHEDLTEPFLKSIETDFEEWTINPDRNKSKTQSILEANGYK